MIIFTQEDLERFMSPETELIETVEEALVDLAPIFKEALQGASPFDTNVNVSLPKNVREKFIQILQNTEMNKVVTPVLWNNGIVMTMYTHAEGIVSLSVIVDIPRLKELLMPTV